MLKTLTLIVFALVFLMEGCYAKPHYDSAEQTVLPGQYSVIAETECAADFQSVPADSVLPAMCIDGELYYDTGLNSDCNSRCGMMDGSITSVCPENELPTVEGQSNFGTGFSYQIGSVPGTYEVFFSTGEWRIFGNKDVLENHLSELKDREFVRLR